MKQLDLTANAGLTYLRNKNILITGGTGSLGKTIVDRLIGLPKRLAPRSITVFSRDEAKQCYMEEGGYRGKVKFLIGDIRRKEDTARALENIDIVFNTAALKQVPRCENEPFQAVLTNIIGPQNVIDTILLHGKHVETVICISTDKACKPVNVMGMTKAIQERIFINAAERSQSTKFVCVRYGNVLTSRGSVIPFFKQCIKDGLPIPITTPDMTRFLLTLDQATDTALSAINAEPGEVIIPNLKAANIVDIARVLSHNTEPDINYIGIRPGEKVNEILISEEEIQRTYARGNYFAIRPLWDPGCPSESIDQTVNWKDFSSGNHLMILDELETFLKESGIINEQSVENAFI